MRSGCALAKFGSLKPCVALAKHIAAYHILLVLAQVQIVSFGGKQFLVTVP